jgi:DNA repair exonuclease SbcCD ATPase subunit
MQENLPGSPKKDIPSSPRVTESALEGASPPSTPPWAAMMTVSSADDGEVKGDSGGSERTIRALEAELTRRNCRIRELERELSQQTLLPLTPTKPSKSPSSSPRHGNDDNSPPSPERSPTAATSRSEDSRDGGSSLASSSEESADGLVAKLRGELEDKASALENAKMIIASLESASGSLAADMRARVKSKDDELAAIKVEMANKQHALDTLATQLRDLQRSQSVVRCNRSREEERSRRLGLSSRLEKNMADFRAALVVLESTTHDPVALELISHLMSDTVQAMKDGIDVLDENLHATDEFSASGCGGDARRLRKELEEKTRAVQRLEEALRGEREECAQLRSERDRSDGTRDAELEALRVEVRSLQEQCCTNMEVLAKKERELVVLRDSLKVDDGVGYISDDGSEASETDADETPVSPVPQRLRYGPSQAEALATLLAQSSSGMGNKSSLSSDAAHELQVLKQELQQAHTDLERYRKQLKTEKESLVNAKMIISSLEKANKSIMDDLRSRLQDSNTAITSLLEKSIENEKMNSKLRVEVETLKKEKEQYETEISTLRSTFLDCRQSSLHGLLAPLEEKKDDKPETID